MGMRKEGPWDWGPFNFQIPWAPTGALGQTVFGHKQQKVSAVFGMGKGLRLLCKLQTLDSITMGWKV